MQFRDPRLPADWSAAPPDRPPAEGLPRRLSTIDPNSADQRVARSLREAAEALVGRREATAALIGQAARAYLQARSLVPTLAQLAAEGNAKIAEGADSYLTEIGLTDEALLKALRRGLELMARGAVSRADEWSARDWALGRRIVSRVVCLYIDMAKERREAEPQPAPVSRPPQPPQPERRPVGRPPSRL
jgi:hypothetical protein